MPADTTTFVLAFAATFVLLGWYLWRLERTARDLEAQLAALERRLAQDATKPKNGGMPGNDP